ncbi:single insulin-like growth factor-binding domain protein-2 [Procambarus clarkii]|uniref:single insulin-like growth factor-binding domain protein-2 n=1 Tax=Procambarus clarkii TaxID=6728 RepID=UPI001E676157|nr:single insulin-like growth factor-binding domain protein-2 [Procambarus clarkii]
MGPLPALLVCMATVLGSVGSLSCTPCREVTCEMPTIINQCSWGLVLDMCGCCFVCGKGPGETCGGQWAWHGRCGRGLDCRHARGSKSTNREGGNALALLSMDEPARCHRRNDTVADKITIFFSWVSSLFQNALTDD